MIRLNRTAGAEACAALGRTDRYGLTETDYALWHFAGVPPAAPILPKPKRPNFKAYKSDPVIAELTAIFGPKCAYCESVYGHIGPMDVEHYRPKSGYLDDKGVLRKPAYYWLAADWNNLLASCPDCNRQRRQMRLSNGKLVEIKLGKGNQFPIAAGTIRATSPAGLAAEVPLLLNPCTDTPGQHLKFRSDGFIEPAGTPQEAALPKGRMTIDVCGLEREGLRAQRRAHASKLSAQMQFVLTCDRNVARSPGDCFEVDQLDVAEAGLAAFRHGDEPYQALVEEMMRTFDHVRPVACAYHLARWAWMKSESFEDRARLEDAVVAVNATINLPEVDGQLAARLFGSVQIAQPAPA